MSHPISLLVWFTDEIRGVGRTAECCRADAHARCLEEHAAYAADAGADPTIEPLEGWLAALAEGGVVELRVEGDAERARRVFCALVRERSAVSWWWSALSELLALPR